jgi:hypothetical protein
MFMRVQAAENQIPTIAVARLMLSFGSRSCLNFQRSFVSLSRNFHGNEPGLPKPPPIPELVTEHDTKEARAWATQFENIKLPKEVVEFSFSRSSGPGGQVKLLTLKLFHGLAFF